MNYVQIHQSRAKAIIGIANEDRNKITPELAKSFWDSLNWVIDNGDKERDREDLVWALNLRGQCYEGKCSTITDKIPVGYVSGTELAKLRAK